MNEQPIPPWKDEELLARVENRDDWGYLAQGDQGVAPQPVRDADDLAALLRDDEQGAIGVVWRPAGKRLETVYAPDELGEALIERDRASCQRQLAESRKPTLALIALVVGGGIWYASGTLELGFGLLVLAMLAVIHLLENGPQTAWATARRLREMANDADRYRQRRDARLRFGIWAESQGKPTTLFLIACLGLCFVLQVSFGFEASFKAVGLDKQQLPEQWWRLFTAAFVHGGLMHIFFNGFALLVLGGLVERLLGGGAMLWVFLLGAGGGGLLSWWLMPQALSVGASGGVLALGGCLLVCAWRRSALEEIGLTAMLLRWTVVLVVIGLVGYQFIDNAGHLGGWLTGMLLAPFVVPRDDGDIPPAHDGLLHLPGAIAAITIAGWTCWRIKEAAA